MSYASGTEVPSTQTRLEIERILSRAGAKQFASGWAENEARIGCSVRGRQLRFTIAIPDANAKLYARDKRGRPRTELQRKGAAEKEERRLWRALLLVIKAKLESVESGIETFDTAFLANIVIPGGSTFGEWAVPQIADAYERGLAMPSLLGDGGGAPRLGPGGT